MNDIHIVDLHIHSHYSRATSPNLNLEDIYKWGKTKGIHVIGTGDFTHPQWFREISEKLEPAEGGLYRLKRTISDDLDQKLPESCRNSPMHFIPTVEISNIYKRGGRVRKVHNVIVMPTIEDAGRLNKKLAHIGNLASDGRPILGMDSRELLLETFDISDKALFIPAHIWTPWFAIFGSKSGFDSLEEAFGDDKKLVYAVETGLSSDPFMNWRLSQLDDVTLVSHSDAHSCQKLGREANIIQSELSYSDITDAIRTNDERFVGTIEFFPQEGKYHWDGHRKCEFRCSPEETAELNGICPECDKALTVGVDNRVQSIADRPHDFEPNNHNTVEYIIPLAELIAEMKGLKSEKAKTVTRLYENVINDLGNEFDLLRTVPIQRIADAGYDEVAFAIKQMRAKNVNIEPGYDGQYGIVQIKKMDRNSIDSAGGNSTGGNSAGGNSAGGNSAGGKDNSQQELFT